MQDMVASEWHDVPSPCAFAALIGPIQRQYRNGRWQYALRVEPKHTNSAGIMHGGAMTALLDDAIGDTVKEFASQSSVTVQMNTCFLRRVNIGDFVEVNVDITRQTRAMIFAEARLCVGGNPVASASLILKLARTTAEP